MLFKGSFFFIKTCSTYTRFQLLSFSGRIRHSENSLAEDEFDARNKPEEDCRNDARGFRDRSQGKVSNRIEIKR